MARPSTRTEPNAATGAAQRAAPPQVGGRPRRLSLPDGVLDLGSGEVQRGGRVEPLAPIEVRFLAYLADHPHRAVPLDELHREVWQFGPRVRTRAVYFAVRKLRERMEANPREPTVLLGTEGRGFELRAEPVDGPRTNLGSSPTSFVGRQRELDELHRALLGARLVTLRGPAGTGKTRLARRYAELHVEDHPGGAWFCDLSEARTLDGVHGAMARVLALSGVDETPGDSVGRALAGLGRTLVILDNFEQVVDCGPTTVARWLVSAPEARFVVTSRQRLCLRGEALLDLEPLGAEDAMALYADRARAVHAPWQDDVGVVRDLVDRLDRLPLAIELAAARAGLYSAADLLARLTDRFRLLASGPRDVPDRQATLHGALEWSWSALDAAEQAALAQITVFRGGFTANAAEAVLDVGPGAPWVADVLQALVDKSLVRRGSVRGAVRFDLLQTILEYADRKLDPASRAAAEERHAAFYARLGATEALDDFATRGEAGRPELGIELDNLVAAQERASAAGWQPSIAATALAAGAFYLRRGPLGAGTAVVRRALETARHRRGELYHTLGRLLQLGRSAEEAEAAFRAAQEAAGKEGDPRTEALALTGLATLMSEMGRLDEAEAAYAEGSVRAGLVGDLRQSCLCLRGLAGVEARRGRLGAARVSYERAWAVMRTLGDRRGEGLMLLSLATLDQAQGRSQTAFEHCEAVRLVALEIGDRVLEGRALLLEATATSSARPADAIPLYEASLQIARETGDRTTEAYVLANLGVAFRAVRDLGAARLCLLEAIAIFRGSGSSSAEGGACLHELAAVDLAEGDARLALVRLAEGEELLRGRGHVIEYGKLLCRRAEAWLALGDEAAARAAIREAESVLEETGAGANSDLARGIAELRRRL